MSMALRVAARRRAAGWRSVSPSSSSVTRRRAVVRADVVDREDVRMDERGDGLGFALESRERSRIGARRGRRGP